MKILTAKKYTILLLIAIASFIYAATTDFTGAANTSPQAKFAPVAEKTPPKPKATPMAKSPTRSAISTATAEPDEVVADLYKQHDADKSPFFQTANRALVDKYFAQSTADLIWQDAIDSAGEVGALGADPLYNAQDTDIKNFKIGKGEIKGKSATVTVTFTNFGEKQTLEFDLVQEKGNWKIENIKYDDGSSLLQILKSNN